MPYYACPNCGSSVSSAAGPAPAACPSCCAKLHAADDVPVPARRDRPPAPVLRVPLGSGKHTPGAARHALQELRGELGEARLRTCELLVSELVTNVVRHASPSRSVAAADLRVRLYRDRVRVEVRDSGPGFSPSRRAPDRSPGSGGWGLHLVKEMADRWGIEPGLQNCVWFELGRTPLPSGMHATAH
jgi:anti-sigma regulatory factor (Ser/Thr protein kinase)